MVYVDERVRDQINYHLRRLGISKRRLAEELDTSPAIVVLWTAGKRMPNAVSLVKLARFFGCSVDDLLGVDDPSVASAASEGPRVRMLHGAGARVDG